MVLALPMCFSLPLIDNTLTEGVVGALQPKDICHEKRAVESLYIYLDSREKRRGKQNAAMMDCPGPAAG